MGRAHPVPVGGAEASHRHFERALLLIARQHGGSGDTVRAARSELERWRQADPAHELAYQAALRGWDATSAAALRDTFALPPAQGERARSRRRVLSALAVGGVLFGLAGALNWMSAQPVLELALQTGRGEMRSVALPDGTRMDLGARTVAQVAYFADRRQIRLGAGEIRLEVAPDAARPLTVASDWGRVRVLGTVFAVRAHDGRMSVAVAEGRVAVWSGAAADDADAARPPDAVLTAGQRIETDAQHAGERSAVRAEDVGAWRQGWLVFDDTPLADAVARWNDHLAIPFVLDADPALRRLRITGSYPLREPGTFVASLPRILPVRVAKGSDGAVTIASRR